MKLQFIATSALLIGASAHAQIAVDGTADASYGDAICSQSIGSSFGNASDGQRGMCNGSELDAAYAKVDVAGGFLYLVIAGNLETNWNKLEVFIDCKAGAGQNMLRSDNADVDFNGLNRMGADTVNALPGLKFDAGFDADFYFGCTIGNVGGTTYQMHAVQAILATDGGGAGGYIGGSTTDPTSGVILINDATTNIQASIDNSNVAGVDGSSGGASSGSGVRTGIEIRLPLALIGWNGTDAIKVCTFVNGSGHDYASNQFLGSLPVGQGHMGADGNGGWVGGSSAALRFDLGTKDGDQFFVVPTSGGGSNCPADLDHDGIVGGSDLGAMLGAWGACGSSCPADLDHDGIVGGSDLGAMLGAWGNCPQ